MSIKSPIRVNQVSTTTGTGAYSLTAATAQYRNFRDQYLTLAQVPYLATDASSAFEIGVGTLTYGSPDQISRNQILASSNSNAAVSWAAGTRHIFAWELAGSQYPITFTSTIIPDLTSWGTAFIFTGSSTASVNLPAMSSVPYGYSLTITNRGSALLTVTPNGSDQIDSNGAGVSANLLPGGDIMIATDLISWRRTLLLRPTNFRVTKVLTAAGDYTTAMSDSVVIVNKSIGAATQVTVPAAPITGQTITVVDGKGDANTNNITLAGVNTFNGSATSVINTSFGRQSWIFNGSQWNLLT